MYAVIRTGGKQYRVAEGDTLKVEKLEADEGASVELDQVLMVADGDDIKVGTPLVDGGKVTALVTGHGRHDKIEVIKFKRRKKYHRRGGGHQRVTLDESLIGTSPAMPPEDLLALNRALQKLEREDKTKADLVKLRFFAGLTGDQAAQALGISHATAERYWAYTRAWLKLEVMGKGE